MAINLYKPWWIPTSNPFDIEDEEPIIPEGMMGLDEIGSLLEEKMPDLWEKAGEFDVSRFEKIPDPVTGKTTIQFPYQWTDQQKEFLQNPSERAAYLLDAYKPLAPLKEKSALHNLNIAFHEKWRYSVEDAFKEGLAIGAPAILGSASRIIIETLDDFTDRSTDAYERDFGEKEDVPKEDEMVEVDGELVPKMWMEPAVDEEFIGPLFESPEQQEAYKEEYKKHIDAINKEKDKEVPDKERIRTIDNFNSWAEEIAIRNMEKLAKKRKKDLRYQAFQTYASEKPADWLTAFQSPEYFTDAVISMAPSVAIMGASAALSPIAGAAAAVGLHTVGHFPLEATGTYTEAYNWTKENTGDEELARSNASWATAEHLAFVAATESWGAMRLLGRIIPKPIRRNMTNGPFKKLYKNNIATPERIAELKRLKETIPGKGVGYMYRALRDPAAEALQEYVQYSGQVLAEAGYKGESTNFLDILSGNHPLISQKEMRESVVGGAIFGGGVGVAGYAANKMKWNKWSNKANTILNTEYGVETGVPNADLTEKSLLDMPSVMGDVDPTPENYFRELLNSNNDEKIIVSRKKDSKKPFDKLIDKHKNYSPGALTEKLTETILAAGQDGWDNVDPSVQSDVNQMIIGTVSNVNEDILDIVSDKDNIAQDILDKKISIDYLTDKQGLFDNKKRKIKVKDKGYVDKILSLYESQLTDNLGEEATSIAKKNYLSNTLNIDIEKQLQKDIKKSIQKKIGKGVDVSIQKQAEKQAEKQIQQQIEQQAIKQLKKTKGIKEIPKEGEPKEDVIGQKALVIEGKFKDKGGEIISYSPKQQLVKMKLDDGTKTPAIKVSQVALTKPPAKQVEEKKSSKVKSPVEELSDDQVISELKNITLFDFEKFLDPNKKGEEINSHILLQRLGDKSESKKNKRNIKLLKKAQTIIKDNPSILDKYRKEQSEEEVPTPTSPVSSKVLKPTPSTVKKPVDDKTKLENRYASLLARRKTIVKNKGKTGPIDREIARVKEQIGDDRKVEDVFVEDKPKEVIKPAKVSSVKKLTPSLLKKNKDKVYLFGDNLLGRGKGGQAVIRDEPNAIGIPTKKAPSMKKGSFFDDAEYEKNVKAIDKAFDRIPEGKEIVLPKDGLGTGRARLEKEAPRTFKYLQNKLAELEQETPTPIKESDPFDTEPVSNLIRLARDKFKRGVGGKEFKDFAKKVIGTDSISKMLPNEIEMLTASIKGEVKTLEEAPINPIIKAEMKIKELSEMDGVTIERAPTGPGYENRIGDIEVDEKLRGQGLGTQVVDAFKDLFKAKDKTKIEIIARPGSEDFWLKQGFEKYGESSELVENENGDMVKPDKMRFWLKERPIKQESIDIDEAVQEDAANLSRAIENFSSQPKAFQYFDAAYKKIKDKYGIDVSDFVPTMQKALRAVENKEQRTAIKNLLSEWAVSIDPAVATKMRDNNDSFKIVELMGYTGKKKKRMEAQISDLNVIDNIVNTLDKQGSEDSHDISREGLSISDVSDVEEISNNMTFNAYDFAGDRFFKFLESTSAGGFLKPKQTAELMEEVAISDYDGFVEYLNKKYKYKPETILDNNMVKNFWVRNQPINRQDASDRPAFWWANMTKDGVKLNNKHDKRFIPKIGGHPKYGKDIRNNQDLPNTVNVSFFDYDNKSYDWNFGKLNYSRLYLNDIVEVIKGQEKDSYYSKQAFIDLSGSMVRNWDAKLSQFAKKDGFARTIISVKSGGNSPSFIIVKASQEIMDISSDEGTVIDYLDYEIRVGNITNQMKKEMLGSMKNESKHSKLNDYVEAQHILGHEVMKRLRGRDYLMRSPHAPHHSRRLAIDDGDGIVAPGTGDFTVKIIDQSKTFVSKALPGSRVATKKIPMSSYIAGLEDKYHGDGSLWVESEYLDKTASIIGREPTSENSSKLREIKTRIRFISKEDDFGNKHYDAIEDQLEAGLEGTHYLAMKHNEFVPEEDIYITDENDNIIVYTSNVNGHIRIFDGNENRVTMFGTLDEAKEPDGGSGAFKLDGRIATDILTLPEESRRIVKIPKQQGHNSAAFPWSWLSHLHSSKFDNLRNALADRMLSVAKMNMDTLFSTRNNPQVMRALMGQMKSDGLSIMNEVDRLIEPMSGQMISDGFMHPHIITGMIEPVKNRMLKENSYGGRRRGFGSYPTIKSDLSRTIVKKEDGVVVSADDVTMTRFLKDLLNVSGYGNELVENINEALRSRKEYLMVGRWPVYTPSAVFLARIEKVIPTGHGAVAWFHPESIVGKMQADHDGDNSFLLAPYFGKNYNDRGVIREMSSESTKQAFEDMDSFVRLEYFARPDTEYKLTKKADMYIISGKLGRGINSQGVLMNSVGFLEDMYFKGFKADIGNQTIISKDPDKETEILKFAKLREDITQEMLDSAKMGTLVDIDGNTWESGDKYLKTTPIKQLHILLQAAVDNAKEFLLADWGYNGYNFIIPKMFVQENGSPIGSKQISTMTSLIRKELMHNLARRGVSNDNNRSQKMEDMFETSREMWEMSKMSGVERGQRIKEKANARRLRYGAKSELVKNTLEIDNITFNNKLTPLEKLLAVPHQSLVDYESNNPNDKVHEHPLGYNPNRIVRGIMQTQKDLYTIQKGTERWYPETKEFEKDKQVARQFINEMTREFYSIMMAANVYQQANKSKITSSGYPYQERIVEFVDKWLNKGDKKVKKMTWNKLSEEQQGYATLRFLRGILKFSPQFQKKVGDKEVRLVNKIMNLREKMDNEPDLGKAERLQNDIEKYEKILVDIHTPSSYTSLSRSRDIEKILPMPLMHPGVWTEFINRFGPNLREASNERINLKSEGSRYEERNTKTIEQLLKDCP